MSMDSFVNPFRPKPPQREPQQRQRRPTRRIISTHMEGPRSPAEITRARAERTQEKTGAEKKVATVSDLRDYLVARGRADACLNLFDCDPWTYEPILLDALIRERATSGDSQTINQLRGLIRAGSWNKSKERRVLQLPDAVERIQEIQRREEQGWQERIRHADPDTSKEHKENLRELLEELAHAEELIRRGVYGEELEPAVRAIEDLNAHAWMELKKACLMHGIDPTKARAVHFASPLVEEIERLRPLRDYVYFLRVNSDWAAKSPPKPLS
jgi:hypothetical protein